MLDFDGFCWFNGHSCNNDTTVDGKTIKPHRHLPSKAPHPKFQCWTELYLTSSVFRVWLFCPPDPIVQPKDNIEIWGCGGWQQYSKGLIWLVWFHCPSTVCHTADGNLIHYIWVNYNDLTATSLESLLIREIVPKWPNYSDEWTSLIYPDIYILLLKSAKVIELDDGKIETGKPLIFDGKNPWVSGSDFP